MTTTGEGTVRELFDRLAAKGESPALRTTSGTYEFDIDGGQWFVRLDHGSPSLEGRADHPDCIVGCSAAEFVDIAQGRRNIVTAFLQGAITCQGDLAFALKFRRLLPVAA
jgi:putative sterol carrier protein